MPFVVADTKICDTHDTADTHDTPEFLHNA